MVTRHSSSIKKRFLGRRRRVGVVGLYLDSKAFFGSAFTRSSVQQPRGVRSRRSPSQARGGCAATGRRMLPHHRRKPCMQSCWCCCRSTATFAAVNIIATAAVARSSVNAPVEYWQQHLALESRAIGCRSYVRRCLRCSSNIPLPLKPPTHLLCSMPIVDMLSRIATAARPLVRQMSGDAAHAAKDATLWKYIGFAATAGSLAFAAVKVS
jgi:hypothetical protein